MMNTLRGEFGSSPNPDHTPARKDGTPPLSILLVEDDPLAREVLAEGLTSYGGYEVHAASNLARAQTFLSSTGGHVDIILLDLRLPDGDGREFCTRLRRQGITCPIILLSGLDGEDAIVGGFEAGADDYLVKPFGIGELLSRIKAQRRAATRP